MRINYIELNNFGSFEGTTVFDTHVQDNNRNIVIIGGKNGTGKTTLFTAIRVCIYGCRTYGYQTINSFYIRNITKLFNNNARLALPAKAYVKVNISVNNGQEFDQYIICRTWTCDKNSSITENLNVIKNTEELSGSAAADFEKYITQLIPPELFNLYFFDGEKIADFFLDDGGNIRLKSAFLTLCGYDTFDIMIRNFHRVSGDSCEQSKLVEDYISAKERTTEAIEKVEVIKSEIRDIIHAAEAVDANISTLDLNYKKSGGVTQEEWNKKLKKIKDEELLREGKNTWLKKTANEILPFLILREQLIAIQHQIKVEEEQEKIAYFLSQLSSKETIELLDKAFRDNNIIIGMDVMNTIVQKVSGILNINENHQPAIFCLSPDQKANVLYIINQILNFDSKQIVKAIGIIKKSIKHSQKIREELDSCNIDTVHLYVERKNALIAEKDSCAAKRLTLEKDLKDAELEVTMAQEMFNKIKKLYEEELKQHSINDISMKAIVMLDKLQERLYVSQIAKTEEAFRHEINTLMRKSKFIDDISIDEKFNIKIYRNEKYTGQCLDELVHTYSFEKISSLIGQRAVSCIKALIENEGEKSLVDLEQDTIVLPVEIDKNSLSNGEKQIFIMGLYKALMELCNHEVPFVIDTPFARIDTEHRQNIVKYFFRDLKGQVFILSTNEEIGKQHFPMMEDKILATYTLENDDNIKTSTIKGKYFGEVC